MGEVYRDLLYGPIPHTLFPDKPPIDEGVYIHSLEIGMNVEPGQPFKTLDPTSKPPETLGNGYMNFWIPGAILWSLGLGMIYGFTYRYMRSSDFSPFSINLYIWTIISFHISNLRIQQALVFLFVGTCFYGLFFGVQASKKFSRVRNMAVG
jgi:hypothetical protein